MGQSAVLPREVKMLAIATAALIALATTASSEPSYTRRVYGSEYKTSYKHKNHDFFDPSYDLHGAYGCDYMRRYDHGHEAYDGGDAYFEESRKSIPAKRYKRSTKGLREGLREGLHLPPECKQIVADLLEIMRGQSRCPNQGETGAKEPDGMVKVDRWTLVDGEGDNPRKG